ncbi:hypothetical protein [Nonomuraea endophytica]|uniref:hypothetical protein n=1 Tax=Nonomuraea endophytica TaxID=714136 RepID=UPI0037C9AF31
MMPQLVTVRVRRSDGRRIRVWVPVLPVLLVCSPVVALAVVGVAVACLLYRVDVVRALDAGWGIVRALPGTRFDIEQGRTGVLVSIR